MNGKCRFTSRKWHTLEELLLKLSLCDLDLNSLVNLLCVSFLVIGVVFDCCWEECVNEGSLSQPGLASNLIYVNIYPTIERAGSQMLTMIVKAAPLFATILWRWLGLQTSLAVVQGVDDIKLRGDTHRFAIPIGDALSDVGGAIVRGSVASLVRSGFSTGRYRYRDEQNGVLRRKSRVQQVVLRSGGCSGNNFPWKF